MNKNIIAEGTTMGTTTHNHKEHTTANAPLFYSAFFESLHKEQWQEVRLGEMIKTNCKSIDKNYPYNIVQYLDTGSITDNKIESLQKFDLAALPSRAKRLVQDNDIIYSLVRPIQRHFGFIKNPRKNLVVSTGFCTITTYQNILDSKFLYYFLTFDETIEFLDLIAEASTSAYPAIKPSDIENLIIPLPPLNVQQQIAEILSSFDDKIDLLHRQNKTLESLALTHFRHTFIDNPNRNDWEMGKLGDYIELFDNKRIPLSKLQRDKMKTGTLYPYYGAANIMDYINDFIFDGDYILMGEDGTVETEDGYPILQYANGKFWINNHAHIFKAKQPYNDFFILNFLKQTNISHIVTGAVQPKINQENLKSIPFYKYPTELVTWFIKITNPYFDKINVNKKQIQNLQSMRDMLLAKILNEKMEA